MPEDKYSHLIARMVRVADAQHALHVHVHVLAGAPKPEAPVVKLPATGAPPSKGS